MNRPPLDKYLTGVSFLLSGCVYGWLKSRSFHWYLSDENIYYYLARDLTLFHIPYRDFFYANPPLLLPLLKAGGVLSGWSVYGLRLVPVGAAFLSGYFLYRIFRNPLGPWAAIPLWILWFSSLALRASTHATGINTVLCFTFLAYLWGSSGRPRWAGIVLGLGCWTKAYALVGVPGLGVLIWLGAEKAQRRRNLLDFLGAVAAMLGLLALLGTLMGGNSFWQMNLGYHLHKPEGAGSFSETFTKVIRENPATVWVLILAGAFAAWRVFSSKSANRNETMNPAAEQDRLLPPAVAGGVHCLTVLMFLALQNRLFDFYFLLLLPGLCLGLGALLGDSWNRDTDPRKLAALALASALLLAMPLVPNRLRPVFKGPVSYWEHEARHIDRVDRLVPQLRSSGAGEIFGDSATAPLIALLADKRLAGGEADTNAMRFRSGYPPPAHFIRRLEESGVEWLVVRVQEVENGAFRPAGLFRIPEFWEYANAHFQKEGAVRLNSKDSVVLFRRRHDAGS